MGFDTDLTKLQYTYSEKVINTGGGGHSNVKGGIRLVQKFT